MKLELMDKKGEVVGTVEIPLEPFEQRLKETEGALASLSSNGSSVSEEDYEKLLAKSTAKFAEKAGEAVSPLAGRLESMEGRLKAMDDDAKIRLVEQAFTVMGQERYLEEGVKRGYITTEESPGEGDDETAVLFSPKDHSNQPGWEYSESLKMWVHVGEKS